jgi:hypothetical protein
MNSMNYRPKLAAPLVNLKKLHVMIVLAALLLLPGSGSANQDISEITPGFLEQWLLAAENRVRNIDLDEFTGPNAKSNEQRRNVLADHLRSAAGFVWRRNQQAASSQIKTVLQRIDDHFPNSGWLHPSTLKSDLAAEIDLLHSFVKRAALEPATPLDPVPPSGYLLPANFVRVNNGEELQAALDSESTSDILLGNGDYEIEGCFRNLDGHRLYAENLGEAVLKSGIIIGENWSNGGAVLQGLVFDVDDPEKTCAGALVHAWGSGGEFLRVLDSVFLGNDKITFGLLALSPNGLVAERLDFRGFTDVALRASDNIPVGYGGTTPRIISIADVSVESVSRPVPGESEGTAEAGLWVGHPVAEGVRRIKVRDVSVYGIAAVNNSWNTLFTDLDIDMSGPNAVYPVGVHLYQFNIGNTFEKFRISGAWMGFSAHWANPAWGGIAAAHYTVIRNGIIDATEALHASKTFGIYLDEGTESTTIVGVKFINQSFAAIGAYNICGDNFFEGNDASLILDTAAPFSTAHWLDDSPW